MTYDRLDVVSCDVEILDAPAALRELRRCPDAPHPDLLAHASTLHDALIAFDLQLLDDPPGRCRLAHAGGAYHEPSVLAALRAIAPHVARGGSIVCRCDRRETWRWTFTGEDVEQEDGALAFIPASARWHVLIAGSEPPHGALGEALTLLVRTLEPAGYDALVRVDAGEHARDRGRGGPMSRGGQPRWLPELSGIERAEDHLLALVFLRDLSHEAIAAAPPKGARWERIVAMPDEHLGRALQAACAACEQTWGEAIEGFFDRIDFERADPATLRRGVTSVTAVRPHKGGAQFGPRTHLGDIYEATRSLSVAQRQGAFFTPYNVASLLARMIGLGPWTSVLDPACGAGVLLIAALDALRDQQGERVAATLKLVGVELDPRTAAVARASLVLAGAHPDQFWIATGDGLEQDIVGRDRSDGRLKALAFHFNLANPPFGRGFMRNRGPVVRQPLVLPERVHYHEHPPQTARAA